MFEAIDSFLVSRNALSVIAVTLGTLGLSVSVWGLARPEAFERFLKGLPRNTTWARALLVVNVLWSAPLTANFLRSMEVPETRLWIVYWVLAPATLLIIWFYVDHYLGARMIGWFYILMAKPVLYACLVRDEPSKLVLVVIAYLWIIAGMFMVAAPHFLRDWIDFILSRPGTLRRWMRVKGALGIGLIALGLFVY